jgi:predicted O-methyltransferase YrrM
VFSAFQLAKKYCTYYLTASNSKGHGVHSPFVFDFIKHIKNDRSKFDCYADIEKLRAYLLKDTSFIEVEDFGAGSAMIKSNSRRIDRIAASSLKPKRFAQLLFRLVQFYRPKTIVELGTSFGISSAYMASGNPQASLYTLEGASSIAKIARQNFYTLGLKNVELIQGDFAETLPALLNKIPGVDMAFIDGNHRKLPTLHYFDELLKKSTDTSILIFDDIHWSKEMEEAWEVIKQNRDVTLTIDLFFIGVVFLRKDFIEKQHFSIRF